MRTFWNGTISFGLVNIPVSVFPATKTKELSFHFLHEKDLGRIHNERVCEKCGKTVPYEEVVKGYEYEDDRWIPLTKEDFEGVQLEAAKNIVISDFVDWEEIDPMFFDKSYYLVPDKKGEKAYVLFREALRKEGKAGIAKVTFHTREHLAAVKANENALMLDIMYFADEIKKPGEFDLPPKDSPVSRKELEMAQKLIESMESSFRPAQYKDTYRENLSALLEEKMKGKKIRQKTKSRPPTNVIDIMSKLKASLKEAHASGKKRKKSA